MRNKVFHGDCLEIMPNLPDKSVDMILCDLPFNTTKNAWDKLIPFTPLWKEYKRLIKDNGAIVLNAQTPFDKVLGASNLDWLKYEWIWDKGNITGFLNANFAPLKQHENILVFSKASAAFVKNKSIAMIYNPQGVKKVNIAKNNTTKSENYDTKLIPDNYTQIFTGYPKSILRFPQERGLHPTQKPVALFEYLIRTYTNEGDLVLDNCAGSFTTAIAAMNTNRDYICIEKDDSYFELGCKRIAEHEQRVVQLELEI